MRPRRLLPVALLLVAVYVATAGRAIDRPGPNYDELIHVNAALGDLDGTFVYLRWGELPVMLMPYLGALKAYLTAPVFAHFGVSEATVRWPVIALTALALLLLTLALGRLFGRGLALLTLALLVVDPSFVIQTRLDYGFVVLGFLAKAAALLCFAELLRTRRAVWVAPLFLSLGTGLFNKLDFIWFINGFLVGAVLCYRQELLAIVRAGTIVRRRVLVLGSAGATACLLGAFLVGMISMVRTGPAFLGQAVAPLEAFERSVLGDFAHQLSGELFFNHCFGPFEVPLGAVATVVLPALLVLGVVLAGIDRGRRLTTRRPYAFCVVLLLATLAQIAATKTAVWAWHTFATYPMVSVALAWSIHALDVALAASPRLARRGRLLTVLLALALVAYQASTYGSYLRAFQAPLLNPLWSSRIHELIDYTRDEPARFVSVDWGLHTPLLTFTQMKRKYWDIAYALNREELPEGFAEQLASDYLEPRRKFRFILHGEETTVFTLSRQHFLAVVAERGYALDVVHEIREGTRVLYQVCVTRPAG